MTTNLKKFVLALTVLSLVTPASAQTLAEMAKKERERRAQMKNKGKASKTYADGGNTGGATSSTAAAPGSASADGGASKAPAKKEKTADEIRADQEKEWGDKVKAAQDEIRALEGVIERNERSLASMVNITPARADMANAIEADKKKLADLKAKLDSLEDERRRAGYTRK